MFNNLRFIVGMVIEIYDYFRLLYVCVGVLYCLGFDIFVIK